MTPHHKILHTLLSQAVVAKDIELDLSTVTDDNVEGIYETTMVDEDRHWDYESEFRSGDVKTGLQCDYSRHYESEAVAAQMSDGSWVGWTYWFGGGKHGEPEAVDWMEDAYSLSCSEVERTVKVLTFTKEDGSTAEVVQLPKKP